MNGSVCSAESMINHDHTRIDHDSYRIFKIVHDRVLDDSQHSERYKINHGHTWIDQKQHRIIRIMLDRVLCDSECSAAGMINQERYWIDPEQRWIFRIVRDRVLDDFQHSEPHKIYLEHTRIDHDSYQIFRIKHDRVFNDSQHSERYIKTYDYPNLDASEGQKRRIHDFEIEDLLFRSPNQFLNEETMSWYRGKNVLITGGGGSIGSELARQIARCKPSRLVILDVYENGAYDVQQELRIKYGDKLNLRIEIASVCDGEQIDKIFREHTPDIVLHAAAHKHVPLMERNVIESVKNNVFGTLNVVEACERYGVKRFIMVSTDKAVNPTNVMGATKRMCEMIVQGRSGDVTSFSATRFGNVLGSNGSVIPLFKRQIANGGPVTITDKRIIRYFMTIPEACQLVMTSGAMASNGELYVLNMGNPVKILDLAENMVRLSGLEPYKDIQIIETGLRPGEKLYEELLIKTEELDKTDNDMIFVERDKALSEEKIEEKLKVLKVAIESNSNRVVKKALMKVVPTYRSPEEVNEKAIESEEMRIVAGA